MRLTWGPVSQLIFIHKGFRRSSMEQWKTMFGDLGKAHILDEGWICMSFVDSAYDPSAFAF